MRIRTIHEAAADLVLRDGLQNLTHRSIASRLGVTHALVVHYEPSIDELRARACYTVLAAELVAVNAVLQCHASGIDQLRELITVMTRPGREDHASLWFDAWGLGRRSAPTAREVERLMESWHEMITRILWDARGAGQTTLADPEECAWEVLALLDGLNAHSVLGYGDAAHHRLRVAVPVEARLGLAPGTLS